MDKSLTLTSEEDTKELAKEIAQKVKPGTVITLFGDLGVGKTTFVQFLIKNLGYEGRVISPTFVLIRKYKISQAGINNFYHIDLYRFDRAVDNEDLGLEDIFSDRNGVVAIEWADKLVKLPKKRVEISFKHLQGNKRKVNIKWIQ